MTHDRYSQYFGDIFKNCRTHGENYELNQRKHLKTTIFFAEISRKFSAVRWFNKTEDCIFPRSFILRSNVQSFNILPSFNLAIYLAVFSQSIAIHNLFKHHLLHLQNCFYLSTLFGSTHPIACIGDFLRAYFVHYKSIVLIFTETNAIKCLSHPAFMTRIIKVFTHVPAIPARLFSICRLFLVAINNNHNLFWSVT